jgi:DNA-binding XRE family transcriptional regulator
VKQPSPLQLAREARAMTRKDLAIALDVEYNRVAAIEGGVSRQIPASWRAAMDAAGFDYEAINGAFVAWRRGLAVTVSATL